MYDAIIVGARCAGASTAMLLARKGLKVLLVDRDAKGSDMPISTHMIWHAGAKKLKDWGLLDRVNATGCTPMKRFVLDLGEISLTGPAPAAGDVDVAIAPKRKVLDDLLVDAAIEAGAEYRPECSVTDLIWENDQVVGIKTAGRNGEAGKESARIVIGADGSNSSIAKMVDAEVANAHPQAQGMYFAYFDDLPLNDMEFVSRPGRMFYSWATNDNQTLAGMCCRYEDFGVQRTDPEKNLHAELAEFSPEMGERVRAAKRATEWRFGATTGFSRKAYGPGWALVGDAGLTVDPISAAGMSHALRDAENLAVAVHQALGAETGGPEALAAFEAERDAQSLPMLHFSYEMGKLEDPPQEMIELFGALYGNQEDTEAYFGVFAQTVGVGEFFDPQNMQRIIEKAKTAAV